MSRSYFRTTRCSAHQSPSRTYTRARRRENESCLAPLPTVPLHRCSCAPRIHSPPSHSARCKQTYTPDSNPVPLPGKTVVISKACIWTSRRCLARCSHSCRNCRCLTAQTPFGCAAIRSCHSCRCHSPRRPCPHGAHCCRSEAWGPSAWARRWWDWLEPCVAVGTRNRPATSTKVNVTSILACRHRDHLPVNKLSHPREQRRSLGRVLQ